MNPSPEIPAVPVGTEAAGQTPRACCAVASGSAPSQRSIEAAWRIWKSEVAQNNPTMQSVTAIAQKIDDIFFPKEHDCRFHRDLTDTCMVCGLSVPNV